MRIFIGVAWPYAAGPRHLGHLGGVYLPADILARAHRLAGDEVLCVSGSDQFGTPITVEAERAGVPPAEFAREQHERTVATFDRVGISFDWFTQTSTPVHERVVHRVFGDLHRAGLVDEGSSLGHWCPSHRRALPDRYVEGRCPGCGAPGARGDQCDACGATLEAEALVEPRCRACGSPATLRRQRQLFLHLERLAGELEEWLTTCGPHWRRWAGREAAGALRGGLRSRAITRDLEWGVPVPLEGWSDRRLYVWFDAVVGYLSATVEWAAATGDAERWRRWWLEAGVTHRYVIGKDNLWFHALWWPAILLGTRAGLHLPDDIVASHHLTEAGEQYSASRGHGTTIDDALERVEVDALRHALCALSPESGDVELDWANVADVNRRGLLGAIGNPCHRVLSLLWQQHEGCIDPDVWDGAAGREARVQADGALAAVAEAFLGARLRAGLGLVHELGRSINRALAVEEPWRRPAAEARRTLTSLVPLLDALAIASSPVVPITAARIRTALGRPPEPERWQVPAERPTMGSRPAAPVTG